MRVYLEILHTDKTRAINRVKQIRVYLKKNFGQEKLKQ